MDGSGYAETLADVDQVTDTLPATNLGAVITNVTVLLYGPGDWYVHLAVQDLLGNQFIRHYGPWHVGTFADLTTAFADRVQTIEIDGDLEGDLEAIADVALEEWHRIGWEWGIFEFMDDFEPPSTPDEVQMGMLSWWDRQRLFATWDGANFFLAWMGAWWTLDGDLWAYLNTQLGGSTQPLIPMSSTLPFDADYALNVTSPTSGTLWAWTGGAWQEDAGTDWEFAQGDGGDTEIRLSLHMPAILDLRLIVFALDDAGTPWAVFPTTNPLYEEWPDAYIWDELGVIITPNLELPIGTSVIMSLDSPQAPELPWGPGNELQYVVELTNLELRDVVNLQLAFDVSAGLNYQDAAGATPAGAWLFDVPTLISDTNHLVTITGQLADDLSGLSAVGVSVTLQLVSGSLTIPLTQDALTHRVDGQPPTVTITTKPGTVISPGQQTIVGAAADGDGIGVAVVEYRVNGGDWQTASGTEFWSVLIPISDTTYINLEVRAKDHYSLTSDVVAAGFPVDTGGTPLIEVTYKDKPNSSRLSRYSNIAL